MTETNSTVLDRVGTVKADLEQLQRKLNRGNTITAIVAILLLSLMAGYFYYGYREITVLLEPETLVAVGVTMVDDQVSQVRKMVKGEVDKNAPVWAEQLSNQVVETMPKLRESLEEYVLSQTAGAVDQLAGVTATEMRKFLLEEREAIDSLLQELSSSDAASEETLATLETAMDNALQASTKEQADTVLGTLGGLREKVRKLAKGTGLNDEEALEREALMIVRRLHAEQGSDSILKQGGDSILNRPGITGGKDSDSG